MAKSMKEIFETVSTHLLTQRAQARAVANDDTSGCRYRGENGMKCAVGILIPDELYQRALEGAPVDVKRVFDVLVSAGVLSDDDGKFHRNSSYCTGLSMRFKMLRELQAIHDGDKVETWEGALRNVKLKYSGLPGWE